MDYKNKIEFIDRINELLSGRKKTPWGKALGFSAGTISRMFKKAESLPSAVELRAIMWSENVSLSWLCEGKGKHFFVGVAASKAEFYENIKLHYDDDPEYAIRIYHAGTGTAVIQFLCPQEKEYKNGISFSYMTSEVEVGLLSDKIQQLLWPIKADIKINKIEPKLLDNIKNGKLGTWALEQVQSDSDSFENVFKDVENIHANEDYMKQAVQLVEEAITEDGTYLDPRQKAKVITAIYKHCESNKIDLTTDMVKLLIDAA